MIYGPDPCRALMSSAEQKQTFANAATPAAETTLVIVLDVVVGEVEVAAPTTAWRPLESQMLLFGCLRP